MGAEPATWDQVHRVPDLGAGRVVGELDQPGVAAHGDTTDHLVGDALVGHEFGDLLPNSDLAEAEEVHRADALTLVGARWTGQC